MTVLEIVTPLYGLGVIASAVLCSVWAAYEPERSDWGMALLVPTIAVAWPVALLVAFSRHARTEP